MLLLFDVTEPQRPYWISESELDKKLHVIMNQRIHGKPQKRENII